MLIELLLALVIMQDTNIELQGVYEYLLNPAQRQAIDRIEQQWDRDRYLDEFWRARDPTPQTPSYNETRELFIQRLYMAINYFSQFDDFSGGWKSDMGHVYIIYGPPHDIIRGAAREGAPVHEVWIYRRDESGQSVELIFEDATGSGDFQLLTTVDFPDRLLNREMPTVLKQPAIQASSPSS